MKYPAIAAVMAATVLAVAACSSDLATNGTPTGFGRMAIINGAPAAVGGTLTLDAKVATLPALGQSITLEATPGTHVLTLTSASGKTLTTANLAFSLTSTGAALINGSDTAVTVSVGSDTTSNPWGTKPIGDTIGSFPPSGNPQLGNILMINSTGVTQFLHVSQVGTDSTEQIGLRPSPTSWAIPYVPGNYNVDLVTSNGATVLWHTTIDVVAGDRWTVLVGTDTLGVYKQQ